MKYKLVIKSGNKTWVKSRSKSKEHLETRAISITKKKPRWNVYVVRNDSYV